ncbi:uncharacterized protein LOC122853279 [Aphidius gifuensis]|uniref:uncharacterized protein LOC122853279 n=1 Tax=Aphidius gifuensis TaxID=684658 RepID=UPI001CDC61A3|nr:uncharacterized protein LOC122853279 [Aphidius gifuensis]XP_044009577.1 uncharacterized protein LOC122853279 [Aphidius gifuensis]
MYQITPISWINKILLISSIGCTTLCLIIENYLDFITFSLIWSFIVITTSTWLCCYILKSTIKPTNSIYLKPYKEWLIKKLNSQNIDNSWKIKNNKIHKNILTASQIDKFVDYIEKNFIKNWYDMITDDETFTNESRKILKEIIQKLVDEISKINGTCLIKKIADILLVHLKEFRRSLRRIEKGTAKNLNDAYKYSHTGVKNSSSLEYSLHRSVTLVAREILPRDLLSSLPGQFLISVLSKQLLTMMIEISKPEKIINQVSNILKPSDQSVLASGIITTDVTIEKTPTPIDLSIDLSAKISCDDKTSELNSTEVDQSSSFDGDVINSTNETKTGLWADSVDDIDDKHSPIYEEPTDFATTIERLRNLLHEKATTDTSPIQNEELTYEFCERSQFLNLAITKTEIYTAIDGSQQILYCIQFDDIEQNGECTFEKTTTIVKKNYSDFVKLHSNILDQIKNKTIPEINLPDGGRAEMEMYLRTLCIHLGDSSLQLRHFLKPSISVEKKADVVGARFDGILAKTVTGVFNTLKTVVPVFEMNDEDIPLPTLIPLADVNWNFVEDDQGSKIIDELEQLMNERTDYCYEAVEAIEETNISQLFTEWWETKNDHQYDDEVDEINENLMMTCIAIDIICEILAGSGSTSTFRQEAVVRWFKLLFGNYCEKNINLKIHNLFNTLQNNIDNIFLNNSNNNIDEKIINELLDKLSNNLTIIFGKNNIIKMLQFLVDSSKTDKINLDFLLRIFDAGTSEFLATCKNKN